MAGINASGGGSSSANMKDLQSLMEEMNMSSGGPGAGAGGAGSSIDNQHIDQLADVLQNQLGLGLSHFGPDQFRKLAGEVAKMSLQSNNQGGGGPAGGGQQQQQDNTRENINGATSSESTTTISGSTTTTFTTIENSNISTNVRRQHHQQQTVPQQPQQQQPQQQRSSPPRVGGGGLFSRRRGRSPARIRNNSNSNKTMMGGGGDQQQQSQQGGSGRGGLFFGGGGHGNNNNNNNTASASASAVPRQQQKQQRSRARSRSPFAIFSGRNHNNRNQNQQQQQQQHQQQQHETTPATTTATTDEKKDDNMAPQPQQQQQPYSAPASPPRQQPAATNSIQGQESPSRCGGRQSPAFITDPSADPLPAQPPRAASPMPSMVQQQQQSFSMPPASPARPGLQEDDDGGLDWSNKLSSMSPVRPPVVSTTTINNANNNNSNNRRGGGGITRTNSRHGRSHSSIPAFSPRYQEQDDGDDAGSVQPPTPRRRRQRQQGHRKSISDPNLLEMMPSMQEVDDAIADLGLPDLRSNDDEDPTGGRVQEPPIIAPSFRARPTVMGEESIFTPPPVSAAATINATTRNNNNADDEHIIMQNNDTDSSEPAAANATDFAEIGVAAADALKTGKGKMRRKGGTPPVFNNGPTQPQPQFGHQQQQHQQQPFPFASSNAATAGGVQQQQQQSQDPFAQDPFASNNMAAGGSSSSGSNIAFTSSFPPPPSDSETGQPVQFAVNLSKPKFRHRVPHARRGSTNPPHHNAQTLRPKASSASIPQQQQQQQQPSGGVPQPEQHHHQQPNLSHAGAPDPPAAAAAAPTPQQPQVQFQSPPPRSYSPSPMDVDTSLGRDKDDVHFNIGTINMAESRRTAFRGRRSAFAGPLASPPLSNTSSTDVVVTTPPLFNAVASSSAGVETPDLNQTNAAAEAERSAAIEAEKASRAEAERFAFIEAEKARRAEAVTALRNEARALYVATDYRSSIQIYTQAIRLFDSAVEANNGGSNDNDTLAVLYSNRAACFSMIGAYEATLDDCKNGLLHVSDGSGCDLSTDGGPILKVKILTRQARALLKQGDCDSALGAFEIARNEATDAQVAVKIMNPPNSYEFQRALSQMETEAALGKMEAERYRDTIEKIERCTTGTAGLERRNQTEALGLVNMALRCSDGSVKLHLKRLQLLSNMKRWREVAGYCERLAASNVELDGVFEGELKSKSPFPGVLPARHLTSNFFEGNTDATDTELKLSSKAAAEAAVRLPHSLAPHYLRALRLEERYPAADGALHALEEQEHVQRLTASMESASLLRSRYSWMGKERSKLARTRTDREHGDELFRMGDYDLAAAQYASCLLVDADGMETTEGENAGGRLHAVLHCNRAACLMAIRKHTEAIEECNRALRIHPRYMKAMSRRSRCYFRLHRFQETISELKRWLSMVEEARSTHPTSSSAAFVSPCLFDGPKDVSDADYKQARQELDDALLAKRRAEATFRDEQNRRRERQNSWQESFHQSSAWNDSSRSTSSARQRRDEWYNRSNDSRPWDSYAGRGPRAAGGQQQRHHRSKSWGQARNKNNSSNRQQQQQQQPVGSPGSDLSVDHYAVLGLNHNATVDEIKRTYKRLALVHHPDKDRSEGAADRFRRIKLAYETLSDAVARRQYDVQLQRRM